MNWPRMKTILIFLFLLVDIILLASIIIPTVTMGHIPQSTIKSTAQLLTSRGIEISPEIIPAKREKLGIIELYNLWPNHDALAKQLLQGAVKTSDGVFSTGSKTLTFSDSTFTFVNKQSENDISDQLNQLKIKLKDNIYEEGETSVRLWETIENKKIFESELYATLNGNECSVSGYWIFSEKGKDIIKNTPNTLVDVTGVLVDFLSNPLRDSNIKITAVELGYSTGSAYRDTSHKLVSVSPAYKINTGDGNYYMYDALSGAFLYACKNGEVISE